ncbi:tRNA (adenosine(37)-N6)-threonylcarbamoyltransferase complex dimerization subunit type 1 TsaB [bacterium]|nr:tRNA (adenosine(37)-N6)-threonylcarbamoyltransferase complex dimerization subunit type 1 TsaB [bacterium]
MLHLILDSSQPHVHWVLAKHDQVLDEIKSKNRFDAAEQTLVLLQALLKKHDLKLDEINAYAYIAGPGSFTGLRIAAASLKALSFAQKQQNIVALDPCHLLAQQYISQCKPENNCTLVPIIASRKNHIYHCSYRYQQGSLSLSNPIQEQAIDQLDQKSFTQNDHDSILFLGPDSLLLNPFDFFHHHNDSPISANTLAWSADQHIRAQNFIDKAHFSPNYIVQSVAKPKHNR